MAGPLFQFMLHGFYINDDFEHVYEKPPARANTLFLGDCSRFLDNYKNEIKYIDKCRLVCLKVISYGFQMMLTDEDFHHLCLYKKIVSFDILRFMRIVLTYVHSLPEEEQIYYSYYIDILLQEQEASLDESDALRTLMQSMLRQITNGKMRFNERSELVV